MMRRLVSLLALLAVTACASNPEPVVAVPTSLGGMVDCVLQLAGKAGYRTASGEALQFQADAVVSAVKRSPEGETGLVAFFRWGPTREQRTIAFTPLPHGIPMFDFRADALRRRINRTCLEQ